MSNVSEDLLLHARLLQRRLLSEHKRRMQMQLSSWLHRLELRNLRLLRLHRVPERRLLPQQPGHLLLHLSHLLLGHLL